MIHVVIRVPSGERLERRFRGPDKLEVWPREGSKGEREGEIMGRLLFKVYHKSVVHAPPPQHLLIGGRCGDRWVGSCACLV